jgi:ferredoxin
MEVEIKFEPSGQVGVVAVGSYLFDAAQRMGIEIEAECDRQGKCSSCAVKITEGRELLSELTAAEMENLSESQRHRGKRLSCQAKIEKQGELVVMVSEKKQTEEEKEEERKKQLRKEFEELPLEKKVANLLELEVITLTETFSFILNSPWQVFGKIMDVMAEFGLKMDDDAKKAKRPAEHETDNPESKTQKKRAGKAKASEPVNEGS